MKFGKETKETYYKFDVDFEGVEAKALREYGLKHIQDDNEALINYAVVDILKNYVERCKKEKKVKKNRSKSCK